MATVQVGEDRIVAGILHVRIVRDTAQDDPNKAFSAAINGPGFSDVLQVGNGASKTFSLSGVHLGGLPASPTLVAEVEDFLLVPPGNSATATALSFNLVFKLVEIFRITVGSVPVHASLR